MATLTETPQNSPFLKQLATSDTHTRNEAVRNLRLFLSGHGLFASTELLKLWKGLFYCMWMSDRTVTQQRLALDLASLAEILRPENKVPFLEAFWTTMAREWNGIDVLRMDKFLSLVRRFFAVEIGIMVQALNSEEEMVMEEHLQILERTPLNPLEMKIPNGLRYHVLDIYVDELEKADEDKILVEDRLMEKVLQPVERMLTSPTKMVRKRARETLDDKRLKDWAGTGTDAEPYEEIADDARIDDDEEGEWSGLDD